MSTRFVLRNGELRATSSGVTAVAKWIFLVTFRFFLGKPISGKKKDNSTFLKGATKGRGVTKPLTRWQKKPHFHRALIRAAVFWPIVGAIALTIWNREVALSVLALSLPFLVALAYRKGRLIFFSPYSYTDAANGIRTQQWQLKSHWRKLFRMQPVPGLVTRKNRIDESLPHELQEWIRRDQAGKNMPMLGNITRYRRKRGVKEVTE
jgi:hypothetical protein